MRHPNIPDPLADALEGFARDRQWYIAYDTHYDAANAELLWWSGKTLNRLDFQPLLDKGIQVTYLTDTYPMLPRLIRWAWRNIPMFPYVARTNYRVVGNLSLNETKDRYAERIQKYLENAA